jgi:SAM-dependent methyltransferase
LGVDPPVYTDGVRQQMRNKDYFKNIKEQYIESTNFSRDLYFNIGKRLTGLLYGEVIDFGNGGVINYGTDRISKLLCIDITNEETEISNQKIDFIYGDFYNMDLEFKVDCVLAQFLLHHLTNDAGLRNSLRQIRKILNREGRVIILEIEFPRFIESLQNISRPIIDRILAAMGKPGLRFFSSRTLTGMLRDTGFEQIRVENIPIGRRISPAPVLFPKLKMPGRFYPFRCILVEAKVRDSE